MPFGKMVYAHDDQGKGQDDPGSHADDYREAFPSLQFPRIQRFVYVVHSWYLSKSDSYGISTGRKASRSLDFPDSLAMGLELTVCQCLEQDRLQALCLPPVRRRDSRG